MEKKINSILDKVKPYIRLHGGDVNLIEAKKGVIKIKVSGTCENCPLANLTYNKIVAGLLKEGIPEIKEIIFL